MITKPMTTTKRGQRHPPVLNYGSCQTVRMLFHCRQKISDELKKQGRIHGKTVVDSWAGAVMQKPLSIQECDGRTYRPTNRHATKKSK